MTKRYPIAVISIAALLLYGCGGPAPQRPTQRKGQMPEPDSAQLALMELNMQLAQTADQAVMAMAQAQEEPMALYESNVWMRILEQGNGTPSLEGCIVHMRICTLDGRLLEDSEVSYVPGKRTLPTGVEDNIAGLSPGARVRLLIPWYVAFGAQGTAHIPPYENVMIDLDIR